MNKKEIYLFRQEIKRISEFRGKATELISLYVPPEKQISDVTSYLRNELSQSSNIKSKSTMKNVTSAIESIMSRLKSLKSVPDSGLAIFVGIVDDKMEHIVLEPPSHIKSFRYRCDSTFQLETLESMCTDDKTFGLVVIDRSGACIATLKGGNTRILKTFPVSLVPSKHNQGGWSQRRFERLIEEALHEFFKKVGDTCNDMLLDKIMGLIVGGPGSTKDEFVAGNFLHHEIKKKVIDTFNVGYTDESGITELVSVSKDALKDLELIHEKELMEKFLEGIAKNRPVIYGKSEIFIALKKGAVDTLLVSLEAESEIVKGFENIAEEFGTKVEYISAGFYEGQALKNTFGGFAGMLRYKFELVPEDMEFMWVDGEAPDWFKKEQERWKGTASAMPD